MLKQLLKTKEYIIGTWCGIPSATVVDIIGSSGLDFVVIDQEHGPIDPIMAENMIRAAQLRNMGAVVRVSSNDPAKILRVLDLKPCGVQVPHVTDSKDAQEVINASKYYPMGERGYTPFTRAGNFGLNAEFHAQQTNDESLIVVNLEGISALDRIEEIAGLEGVDVIFVGPYDLSQSMGMPGQVDHPDIFKKITMAVKIAQKYDKICGSFANTQEYAEKLIEVGVRYITYKVDSNVLASAYTQLRQNLGQVG